MQIPLISIYLPAILSLIPFPLIVPTKEFAFLIESLADKAIKKKQKLVDNDLEFIEEEIEDLIKTLYSI